MDLSISSIGVSLLLGLMTILFIFRIVLSWYPQIETAKFPLSLVVAPTEPFLKPLRKVVPPIGGVDISPIVMIGACTFIREILVGQQGLITMALHH